MSNLFNILGGGNSGNPMMNKMAELQMFMNSFKGDPKQQVMQMIQSKGISQSDLEKLANQATQLRGMLPR